MSMPGGRPPGQSSSSSANRTNDSSISSNSNVPPNPMSDSKSGTMQRQSASVASNVAQTATMHRTMNENNQALVTAQIALELNQRLAGGVGGPSTSHQHPSVPSTASFPPRSLPPLKYNTGRIFWSILFELCCLTRNFQATNWFRLSFIKCAVKTLRCRRINSSPLENKTNIRTDTFLLSVRFVWTKK